MYIVTGGAGFIGSQMVAKLNEEGIDDILIVDELKDSTKWTNLRTLSYTEYVHKDVFITDFFNDEFEDIEAVIHMGASSSTTEEDMDYLHENNYLYTRELAHYCIINDIRFIYASSAATYGGGERGFEDSHEIIPELLPLNRYGYSKQIFDQWALKVNCLDKIAGLKFFNVYGPGESHKGGQSSVIYHAWNQIRETGKVKLFKSCRDDYANGEQMRDFVYVKDCTDVMWWLLNNKNTNGIFNVGSGKARTWNDLAKAVFSALSLEHEIEYIDMPDNIIRHYQYFSEAPMNKLKSAGYKGSATSLEDGVKDYVEYLEGSI